MRKLVLAFFLLSVVFSGFTYSQGDRNNNDKPFLCRDRITQALNLNDDQLSKFNEFKYQHQKEVIDLKSEIEKNRLEIQKMMRDNNVDPNRVKELTSSNSKLHADIQSSKVDMWLNIHNILDKDQQKIWNKHFEKQGRGMRKGNRESMRKNHHRNFRNKRRF